MFLDIFVIPEHLATSITGYAWWIVFLHMVRQVPPLCTLVFAFRTSILRTVVLLLMSNQITFAFEDTSTRTNSTLPVRSLVMKYGVAVKQAARGEAGITLIAPH